MWYHRTAIRAGHKWSEDLQHKLSNTLAKMAFGLQTHIASRNLSTVHASKHATEANYKQRGHEGDKSVYTGNL